VEVTGDRVSIVTDMAVRAQNIDEAKVEEAVSVTQPAFATSFLTKKWLPSMPVWLAHWYNFASSAAATPDPHGILGPPSFFRLEERQADRLTAAGSNLFLSSSESMVTHPFPTGSAAVPIFFEPLKSWELRLSLRKPEEQKHGDKHRTSCRFQATEPLIESGVWDAHSARLFRRKDLHGS
jgi:hypothetical protein